MTYTIGAVIARAVSMLSSTREGASEVEFSAFWQAVLGAAAGGIGAYIGIRERLARVEEKTHHVRSHLSEVVNTINRAHERIDELLSAPAKARRD